MAALTGFVCPNIRAAVACTASVTLTLLAEKRSRDHGRSTLACQVLPSSAVDLRSIHELRGPQEPTSSSLAAVPRIDSPLAGSRLTRAVRQSELYDRENIAVVCAEATAAVATDLATYWSNSVSPYALRGSPFLRPYVFSSLWRLTLDIEPDLGHLDLSAERLHPMRISTCAEIKCAHERRLLEFGVHSIVHNRTAVDGADHHCIARGTAWCLAHKSGPRFECVVVPPVPLGPVEMEESSKRYVALNRRQKRLGLVREGNAQVSRLSRTGHFLLTVKEHDADGGRVAAVYGRKTNTCTPTESACGDISPLLRSAFDAACENVRARASSPLSSFQVWSVELEVEPMAPGVAVEVFARMETGGTRDLDESSTSVLVTAWSRGEPVLRLRMCGSIRRSTGSEENGRPA
eukprot:TRINITY_DN15450_c0_g1_i1.p1 TRINITY_DN15450_c0_g1~~TRINITY_DN15450_c0_g1_i1.p1  ORF type:complete len:452 (+),score=30.53 TRINITY_DN15450_c0_g1_i1:144-1358(+)